MHICRHKNIAIRPALKKIAPQRHLFSEMLTRTKNVNLFGLIIFKTFYNFTYFTFIKSFINETINGGILCINIIKIPIIFIILCVIINI